MTPVPMTPFWTALKLLGAVMKSGLCGMNPGGTMPLLVKLLLIILMKWMPGAKTESICVLLAVLTVMMLVAKSLSACTQLTLNTLLLCVTNVINMWPVLLKLPLQLMKARTHLRLSGTRPPKLVLIWSRSLH